MTTKCAGPRPRKSRAEYESQWGAITSLAGKIGCTAETRRLRVRQSERDQGQRPGVTTEEQQRLRGLERENREFRRANEILRKAFDFVRGNAKVGTCDRARLWVRLGDPLLSHAHRE